MIPILFNPSSGKGKALKQKNRIKNRFDNLSINYKIFVSKDENHMRELVKELSENNNEEIMAVAGGDSTFTIVANELIKNNINKTIAMIGIGSSNDIPREFNIQKIDKIVHAIKEKRSKFIDLGLIESKDKYKLYFIGQANIGLGAFVNRDVEMSTYIKKKSPQIIHGLHSIIKIYKNKKIPIEMQITTDSEQYNSEWTIALFSNIRYWATGKLVLPDAKSDDGYLDGFFLKKSSFLRLVKLGILASKGKHAKDNKIIIARSKQYIVESNIPFFIQADGDILGGWENPKLFNRIIIKNIPKKLKIISDY